MRTLLFCVLAACLVLSAWVGHAQQGARASLRTTPVADGLHLIAGQGGNVAAYVTGEGVVLVDDMFHRNHADIMSAVQTLTDEPLRYVLNTHQHDDHAGGNALMLPLAEVIAHRNARANLIARRQPFFEDTPGTPIGLPRVTFSDELSVHVGGKEIRALHFGRAHTSGDAVIYFPEAKAVHTGDLFLVGRARSPGGPASVPIFVDYAQGGSFLEWTTVIDRLLGLDFEIVIPGHGPVAARADVVRFRADLEAMRDRIAGFVREGMARDALVTVLERDYGWRATGCPPSPPTPGCLQYQQVDALMEEFR